MKFKANHRYLVRFVSFTGVTEVKCLEVSPSGWVKLRLKNGEEVWYSPDDQASIVIVDDLGADKPNWFRWRARVVNE